MRQPMHPGAPFPVLRSARPAVTPPARTAPKVIEPTAAELARTNPGGIRNAHPAAIRAEMHRLSR